MLCPPLPPARPSLLRCQPAPPARVLVPASHASSRSGTLGSSTTLAPPLDRVLPGAPLPPPAQAPTLMGSMDSARQPAHPTQPQQPPPPQPQQQPQPLVPLLPQLQPRRPPAAPRAPSPRSTATPASATPSGSTFAAPSPAQELPAQPRRQQPRPPPPPQRLLQHAQSPLDLQLDRIVCSPSHMEAPHSQAVLSGCTEVSTRASCGAAPRLTPLAPM